MQGKFQHIIAGLALLLCVIAGALAFKSASVQAEEVGATDRTASVSSQVAAAPPQGDLNEESIGVITSSSTDNDVSSSTDNVDDASPLTDPEMIINTVQSFAQQRREALLGQAGWIQVKTELFYIPSGSQIRSAKTGTLHSLKEFVPDSPIQENWYHVDEKGNLREAISLMTSPDGSISQQSIWNNGRWVNLTLKEANFSPNQYTSQRKEKDIDIIPVLALLKRLQEEVTWSGGTIEAIEENGRYIIVVEQQYDKAISAVNIPEPAVASRHIYTLDSSTGQFLSQEAYALLESGTWFLTVKNSYTTEFMTQLPADIAQLFSASMNMLEEAQ